MKLAVLVNTCDKFRDCWDPFFLLWKKYGLSPECCHLYLNTEYAEYAYPGSDVTALKVCSANHWQGEKPPTWSWCLARALEAIKEDYVLYMQEDYFLDRAADEPKVREMIDRMEQDREIDCIHLSSCSFRRKMSSDKEGLRQGDPRDLYFANCQAAIWRKECLVSLVREYEDAWQFERWASKRAQLTGKRFYVANPQKGNEPLSYILTGVIQGKWYEPVVALFAQNGIEMDFSRRGFYEGPYGKREGRFFAYYAAWVRWAVRAALARYVFPLRSLREIVRMYFCGEKKN